MAIGVIILFLKIRLGTVAFVLLCVGERHGISNTRALFPASRSFCNKVVASTLCSPVLPTVKATI